jgi:hypothetical protein
MRPAASRAFTPTTSTYRTIEISAIAEGSVRLAVDKAPEGPVLQGVGEEGVTIRAIAELIGRQA